MKDHCGCAVVSAVFSGTKMFPTVLLLYNFFLYFSTSLTVFEQTTTGVAVCADVCVQAETSSSRNPRATDALQCQIDSHNSHHAATNVNWRKGESVQSLSTAILTGMFCTCSVETNRKTDRRDKTRSQKLMGIMTFSARLSSCSHRLSVYSV